MQLCQKYNYAMYDILNVGNHYLLAERFYNKGDFDNAIKYYKSAIDNYNNADNEYLLSPSSCSSSASSRYTIPAYHIPKRRSN